MKQRPGVRKASDFTQTDKQLAWLSFTFDLNKESLHSSSVQHLTVWKHSQRVAAAVSAALFGSDFEYDIRRTLRNLIIYVLVQMIQFVIVCVGAAFLS